MQKNEPSNYVKLAATNALYSSLGLINSICIGEAEENQIMQAVCDLMQNDDQRISVSALQCLVGISSLYYSLIAAYMSQSVLPFTLEAMKSKDEDIALQGLEFWLTVSEIESDPFDGGLELYVRGAVQYLVPILIQKLVEKEFDKENGWNSSKVAHLCLMNLTSCCKSEIVPLVFPFVEQNIKSTNRLFRQAAMMILDLVLDHVEGKTLKEFIQNGFPSISSLVLEENTIVRNMNSLVVQKIFTSMSLAHSMVCHMTMIIIH